MGHPPKSDPGIWLTITMNGKRKAKVKFELAEN
jgi:hypothetical protein